MGRVWDCMLCTCVSVYEKSKKAVRFVGGSPTFDRNCHKIHQPVDSDVKFYHSKEAHGNRKDIISKENMYFALFSTEGTSRASRKFHLRVIRWRKKWRTDECSAIFWSKHGSVQSVYTMCAGVISEALSWQSGMPQSRCPKETID